MINTLNLLETVFQSDSEQRKTVIDRYNNHEITVVRVKQVLEICLNPRDYEYLYLKYLKGVSCEEISQEFKSPTNTIYRRIQYITQLLYDYNSFYTLLTNDKIYTDSVVNKALSMKDFRNRDIPICQLYCFGMTEHMIARYSKLYGNIENLASFIADTDFSRLRGIKRDELLVVQEAVVRWNIAKGDLDKNALDARLRLCKDELNDTIDNMTNDTKYLSTIGHELICDRLVRLRDSIDAICVMIREINNLS